MPVTNTHAGMRFWKQPILSFICFEMVSLSRTTFSFTNQYNAFTFELQLSLFICRQVLLVGNKQDLEHLREVELHEGEALASQYKIAFSEVIFKIAFSKVIFKGFFLCWSIQSVQVSVAESPDHLIALLNSSVLQVLLNFANRQKWDYPWVIMGYHGLSWVINGDLSLQNLDDWLKFQVAKEVGVKTRKQVTFTFLISNDKV